MFLSFKTMQNYIISLLVYFIDFSALKQQRIINKKCNICYRNIFLKRYSINLSQ